MISDKSCYKLKSKHRNLLEKFNVMDIVELTGMEIDMVDMVSLTEKIGLQYSLFSKGTKHIIIKGTDKGIVIPDEVMFLIMEKKYKWVGHTHIGDTKACLIPSESDYETLKSLRQRKSDIFNSVGMHYTMKVAGIDMERLNSKARAIAMTNSILLEFCRNNNIDMDKLHECQIESMDGDYYFTLTKDNAPKSKQLIPLDIDIATQPDVVLILKSEDGIKVEVETTEWTHRLLK